MKPQLRILLVCLTAACTLHARRDATLGDDSFGQTFFTIRPEFQTPFPEKTSLVRDRTLARCEGIEGAFQVVPLGGRSAKAGDLMKYFSPYPKTELIVDSLPPGTDQTDIDRDINPVHFGIRYTANGQVTGTPARYRTTLKIRPQRSVGGIGFTYKQYIGRKCNPCKKWFIEVSGPVLFVRNKVNITETNTQVTGFPVPGSATDMTQAFMGNLPVFTIPANTNTPMLYGKINDNSSDGMKDVGFDVEIKFGVDTIMSECFHFDGYFGLHVPGSTRPKGEYLFEAIAGFNQHFGFMIGGATAVQVWQDCDRSLTWEIESVSQYFVHNVQVRSFDLINRAWSRYMLVRDASGVIVPGINVFTRQMKVNPRFSFDVNTGIVYNIEGKFQGEFGYNLYARQGERVRLVDRFPSGLATVGFNDVTLLPDPTTITRKSDIGDNGENLPAPGQPGALPNETIFEHNLNLLSASHPAALSNLVYFSLGYQWDNLNFPVCAGLGASYEISGKNTALTRWLVWGKFCVSV
ncbi:MAG: hypothetical protein AB7F19_02745 [Candidatus Babeliales bacterium]